MPTARNTLGVDVGASVWIVYSRKISGAARTAIDRERGEHHAWPTVITHVGRDPLVLVVVVAMVQERVNSGTSVADSTPPSSSS